MGASREGGIIGRFGREGRSGGEPCATGSGGESSGGGPGGEPSWANAAKRLGKCLSKVACSVAGSKYK